MHIEKAPCVTYNIIINIQEMNHMIYRDFQDKKLPLLSFGAMRLPVIEGGKDKDIDFELFSKMVDYSMEHGVNYFDTAFPYHGGMSEIMTGKALSKYPRESYYLATKYPGHQISDSYDPAQTFELQLKKCGVEYFDFYLLHNVCESSMDTYSDDRWGIIDYFAEQRRLGRIRHLGFSSHGRVDNLREVLDRWGDKLEFCQIQLNYVDWTLQDAKAKYELLTERGIPVWVMEPVRGGKLAGLSEENENALRARRPDDSIASWAFRWLMELPNVTTILSGMSNMEQVIDNVRTFSVDKPLDENEKAIIAGIAEGMQNTIPCTGCRYCCDGCPMELDIPMLLDTCNELRFSASVNTGMRIEALPAEKRPHACIGCGACVQICPQKIDIPERLTELAGLYDALPKWSDISKVREAEAEAIRKQHEDC